MADLRSELIATARALQPAGLNRGTAGNVSVRHGDNFYITPTGMPYTQLVADDIPLMALDGSWQGPRKPSSEWRFHRDLYASRPEVGAVLHAHSPFAVSLACLRRELPAFHYMVAVAGGVRLTVTFPSREDGGMAITAPSGASSWRSRSLAMEKPFPCLSANRAVPICLALWDGLSS